VKLRALQTICAVLFASAVALGAPRSASQEQAIDAQLTEIDPTLVALAHGANDAADRGDWATATREYARVHASAPHVPAITRRLGIAEARSGNSADGIAHCREALKEEPSAENEAAVASAILASQLVDREGVNEAIAHARRAVRLEPNSEVAQAALCEAALARKDTQLLATCSAKLRAIAPDALSTHLFASYVRASEDDWDGAQRELDAARAAGYPDASYKTLNDSIARQRALRADEMRAWILPGALAAWVTIVFAVFVIGMMFSDAAERSKRLEASAGYRAVLRVAALAFWPSVIVCSGGVAILVLRLVNRFLEASNAPRWVIAAIGVAALYLVASTVRTLLTRVEDDFGVRVDLAKEDALREALDDASSASGVAADEVWIAPDASIEAFARKKKRVLVIGAAALGGLTRRELVALVACELGKLASRATMERAAMDAMCDAIEARGLAGANPAWWFVSLYRRFYLRISDGAARAEARHAEKRVKTKFGASTIASAREHLEERAARIAEMVAVAITTTLDGAEKPTTFYDHDASDAAREDAWALFSDREVLERALDEKLWTRMRERAGFAVDQARSASSVARA